MQAPPIPTGTLLQNRYRLVGVASQGTFGQTYLARDQQSFNQLCVLKEFTPQEQNPELLQAHWQRFNQAAAVLYRLQHAQLPKFQALIAQDQRFYWVREYIEGKSYGVLLEERRAVGQAFSEAEVLQLLGQVLPVLHYLHLQGVVHRNITPDSLIQRQADNLPVLVNFGLVNELVVQLKLHSCNEDTLLGEWGYAPPEQLAGNPSPASDVFALAVTAIVLMTGRLPEELYDAETQVFDWEAQVKASPAFKQLLWQMLAADPSRRLESAAPVIQAIQPLLGMVNRAAEVPRTRAVPAGTAKPAARKRDRRRSKGADLTASMLLGAGLGLLFLVIGWRVVSSWKTLPFSRPTPAASAVRGSSPIAVPEQQVPEPQKSTQPTPEQSAASPAATPAAEAGGEALRDRRRNLNIDYNFFTQLVDEWFYTKYPQLRSQRLNGEAQQATLKNEWNSIATSLMDRLEKLTPEVRPKLGSYRREDYKSWLVQLGETGNTSKILDPLADARFYQLFPEMRGQALNPKTFGQIWYAIAGEQLANAKSQGAAGRPKPTSAQ